jgi:hypothetical protein
MQICEMDTFVATCRSAKGAVELARFMEGRFPFDSSIRGEQIHKFIVVVDVNGTVEVHSTVAVNALGRADFHKIVAEFSSRSLRRPVQSMRPVADMRLAA